MRTKPAGSGYDASVDRTFLLVGSVFGFLGVALGAFAAHGLKNRLSVDMLAIFETGVRYHMYHTFAVLLIALAIGHYGNSRLLVLAGWLLVGGILVFSGSLYALAVSGVTTLCAITPIGGLLFLAGWVCLAAFAISRPASP